MRPPPLKAVQNPGWSAQRHRRGRRPEGRNCPRPKLDLMPSPSYSRLEETGGRRHPRRKAGAAWHAKTGVCSDKPAGPAFSQTTFGSTTISATRSLTARLGRVLTIAGRTVAPGRPAFSHLAKNRDHRSRAPPPPPAEGATSLLLRRLRGRLLKRTSPHGLCPRALGKYFCFNSSLKQSISLLRRGARVPLGTRTGLCLP